MEQWAVSDGRIDEGSDERSVDAAAGTQWSGYDLWFKRRRKWHKAVGKRSVIIDIFAMSP
ncbi:hypothetical protein BM451_02230 [Dickeya dadantii]|nr:hypothetical protein BM451_02230 [Dickeya dadantii]